MLKALPSSKVIDSEFSPVPPPLNFTGGQKVRDLPFSEMFADQVKIFVNYGSNILQIYVLSAGKCMSL